MCSDWGKVAYNQRLLGQVVRRGNHMIGLTVCKYWSLSHIVRLSITCFYTPIFGLLTQLSVMLCTLYTGLITSTTNINYLFIISRVGGSS
jgi:hypothetical protein